MKNTRPSSFDLNEDMLSLLAQEFDVKKVASTFAQAAAGKGESEIDRIGRQVFEEYGRSLMKRSLELGDEYQDRTYQVLKAAADKTKGYLAWPLLPQRFIEVAFLGTQGLFTLPIVENSARCLSFRIVDCLTHRALKQKCGQKVADALPCKHGCLAACHTAFHGLGLKGIARLTATVSQQGYCEFTITRE